MDLIFECLLFNHRCARGTYSLLMSRLKARICTPPQREKNTPPPQINSHPHKEFWKNIQFFSINFTCWLYFLTKFNWNKSIFKKVRLRRPILHFYLHLLSINQNIARPPTYLNSISAIVSLLLSHSTSFASLAALCWGYQFAFYQN